jgi:hypothetical protein
MFKSAAIVMAAAAALAAAPRTARAQTTFTCESYGGRQQVCQVDTRGGVQMVRQLSSAPCLQGRTFGYARNAVWVSGGCRAQFQTYTNNGARRYGRRANRYNGTYNGNGGYYQTPGTGNSVPNGARICQRAVVSQYGLRSSDMSVYLENDGSAYARYAWQLPNGAAGACYFDANGSVAVRRTR